MTLPDMTGLGIRSTDLYRGLWLRPLGNNPGRSSARVDVRSRRSFLLRSTICASKKIHTRLSWKEAHAQGRRQVE